MNILYYKADKINYEQLHNMAKLINEELGETIFLPDSVHLLTNVNADTLIHTMEQLSSALEKIKEERPEEYKHAKEMSQFEYYRKIIKKNLK